MKFMLLFFADEQDWMGLSEVERSDAIARIGEWYGQQERAGRIVGGARLGGKATATTVRLGRAGRSGRPMVTDGPFIETKEAIGSYAIIVAADRAEAVAVAETWPGGGAVEIRPLAEE